MSISKRKDGKYRMSIRRFVDGQKFEKQAICETKQEAKVAEAEFLTSIQQGKVNTTSLASFEDYASQYINSLSNLAEQTVDGYKYALNRALPHIGHMKLNRIKNNHIKSMANKLFVDLSARTVSHTFKIVKAVLDQAVMDDILAKNPCGNFYKTSKIKMQAVNKKEALTVEEMTRLKSFLQEEVDKNPNDLQYRQAQLFALIALRTGLRRGELGALKWSDIDLDNKTLSVNRSAYFSKTNGRTITKLTKTEAGLRTIQLDDQIVDVIADFKSWYSKEILMKNGIRFIKDWLFHDEQGELVAIYKWSHRIGDRMKKIGIKKSPHDLRHTHASILLMNDFPLMTLSQRMGHADASITLKHYGHFVKGLEVDVNDYIEKVS